MEGLTVNNLGIIVDAIENIHFFHAIGGGYLVGSAASGKRARVWQAHLQS